MRPRIAGVANDGTSGSRHPPRQPMRAVTTLSRKARSLRAFARGLTHTAHPLLVQIIPIRRCNIDCGYCNEYDKVSAPVETAVLKARIDKLKQLGTSVV